MEITHVMQEDIVNLLGLADVPVHEQEAVFADFGKSIIEAALLQFLASQTEWEQQSFEAWINEHTGRADMLEQLVILYPTFGKILTEEIMLVKENFKKSNASIL